MRYVEALIEARIKDFRIFVSSRHLERNLPVDQSHLLDDSLPHFADQKVSDEACAA